MWPGGEQVDRAQLLYLPRNEGGTIPCPQSLLSLTFLPTVSLPPTPQLSHFSPPKAATFPAESVTFCNLYDGGCSCKQDGIFIWTLFPVCRLGGFICWYLVLSFLIQTQLPLSHQNRDVCLLIGYVVCHQATCSRGPCLAHSPLLLPHLL